MFYILLILLFLISFFCYLIFHVCGMYACFYMCMDACVCEVDAGNHTWSLFHHIHWVKVFESSTVLKDMACLTSQLALRNPHFYLPRLELYAVYSTHPTFMWVSWDPNSGLQTTCFNCILSQWWFFFTWPISIFKNCQRNT